MAPLEAAGFHLPRDPRLDLAQVFCLEKGRVVGNDWVVRYDNRARQILPSAGRNGTRNREGQVGTGTTTPGWELQPVPALGALGETMRIAVGTTHSCSLNSQGETYCWGANTNGVLGDGTTTARLTGVPTSGGVLFVAITAGLNHTCGLRQSGATYCWGLNGSGRLGEGTLVRRTVPVQVVVP